MTTATQTMKFKAKAKELISALKPIIEIATKGVVKDNGYENRITLNSNKSELVVAAFGGRLGCNSALSNITYGSLDYECEGEGEVTVTATDLLKTLESFPNQDELVLTNSGRELIVARSEDEDEFQGLPLYDSPVEPPELVDSFDKELSIDCDAFIKGVENIQHAIGFEAHRELYLYWQVMVKKDYARFSAGTGGRFAIFELKNGGFGLSNQKKKVDVLFPKDQTSAILSILKSLGAKTLKIKENTGSPSQIVFEADGFTFMLVGYNPNLTWPDVSKKLDETRACRLKTSVREWVYATKGLMATYNEAIKKEYDSHESDICPDVKNDCLVLTAKTGPRANRKVKIDDAINVPSSGMDGLSFHCNTVYIAEVSTKIKADKVEVQFDPDPSGIVYIIAPEKEVAGTDTKEQFRMFFGTVAR